MQFITACTAIIHRRMEISRDNGVYILLPFDNEKRQQTTTAIAIISESEWYCFIRIFSIVYTLHRLAERRWNVVVGDSFIYRNMNKYSELLRNILKLHCSDWKTILRCNWLFSYSSINLFILCQSHTELLHCIVLSTPIFFVRYSSSEPSANWTWESGSYLKRNT